MFIQDCTGKRNGANIFGEMAETLEEKKVSFTSISVLKFYNEYSIYKF